MRGVGANVSPTQVSALEFDARHRSFLRTVRHPHTATSAGSDAEAYLAVSEAADSNSSSLESEMQYSPAPA